jgi:segregation and condensation protein A
MAADRGDLMAADLVDVSDDPRDVRAPGLPREGDDAPPASFVVELAHFSGPLDLLLTLLREEQIDIYDIPIARIAEQFLVRIRTLRLDEAAEYLEMAARLLRIKAQMLLPRRDGAEAWDDPRAELVRRLLEYQQVREVVDVLERRAEGRRNRFARTAPPAPERQASAGPLSVAMADLLAAIDRLLRATRGPDIHAVIPRALDVAGALAAARSLLARRARLRWRDLVRLDAEPWEILSVLLAVLELARLGECVLRQPLAFGAVEIIGLDAGPEPLDGDSETAAAPVLSSHDPAPAYDTASAAA